MFDKKYHWILLDLDDTIFDYGKTEYSSFRKTCLYFFGDFCEDNYKSYHEINKSYWTKFQDGEVSLQTVKTNRFIDFGKTNFPDIKIDPLTLSENFIDNLSESVFLLDGALEFLDFLKRNNFEISIITNGIKRNQLKRIELAEIGHFFNQIIISEDVGKGKPAREYFDFAEKKIGFEKSKTLVVGDNIQSDIKGAIDYGIDSCWFNIYQTENHTEIQPTYEANSFEDLKELLVTG